MYADLHIHSSYSDGSYSPAEIVAQAEAKGVQALALTDHSTIQGLEEFKQAAAKSNLTGISGVEISAYWQDTGVHILGYFIDQEDSDLQEFLSEVIQARRENTKQIVNNLAAKGELDCSWEQVIAHNPDKEWLSCSDVYLALVADGVLTSRANYWDFYQQYFRGKDQLDYVSARKAVEVIRGAGGIPVLAHPKLLADDQQVKSLINQGISGLEVFHPVHDSSDREKYQQLVRENDLLMTGGTDWHGELTANKVELGACGVKKNQFAELCAVRD